MVVTVPVVRVVKVAFDQVIDMVAVGNRGMAAVGAMLVTGIVACAMVSRSATIWVFSSYTKAVLFDLAPFLMVQMAIMEVIDMAFVDDAGVTTGGTVFVLMIFAGVSHFITSDRVKDGKESRTILSRETTPEPPEMK